MKKILRFIVFAGALIVSIPFGMFLIGYTIIILHMIISAFLGISSTALIPLGGRWLMQQVGLRKDPDALSLGRALPTFSSVGYWLLFAPLYHQYWVTGRKLWLPTIPSPGEESHATGVYARTIYFDQIIARNKTKAQQFVMLGAGYDTRGYSLMCDSGLTCYELDQARIQRHKRKSLAKTNSS